MKNKCVFLDRDGVICVEVNYMSDPSQFKLLPRVVEALYQLKKDKYKLIVVSNQSGVARGFLTEDIVRDINNKMLEELTTFGVKLDRVYYCPHHSEGKGIYKLDCTCRKPKPGMLLQGTSELNVDLASSYMIGDRKSDIIAGVNTGCKTILVLTGYGKEAHAEMQAEKGLKPDYVVDDLFEASNIILKKR